MRDFFLAAIILAGLGATLRFPFAGILLWTWLTCMDPHQDAFGFIRTMPVNLVVAIVTILAWGFSRERKTPTFDAANVLILTFLAWITFNGFFAVDPALSWPLWNQTWKTIALGIFVSITANNRTRVHALVWTVVMSLLFYSIKGGLFTIMTGGAGHVQGPTSTMIGDNNTLALATLMVLPLANYLRLYSVNRWVSWGLFAAIALSAVSVVGSYSRGAFIALGGLGVVSWFRTRRKFLYPIVVALIIIPAFTLMPQAYYDRLDTIRTASDDSSFHGRVVAWQVAWRYASEHFPFGAGMAGPGLESIFNHYFPNEVTHAAHSIYFQVLGDDGFVGLGLYLAIIILAFYQCSKIRKQTRGNKELAWAFDLASMIQLSLFVFCLGGAALSMAYYDVLYIWIGLLSALRGILNAVSSEQPQGIGTFKLPNPATSSALLPVRPR